MDDMEEELMDLDCNESVYLPASALKNSIPISSTRTRSFRALSIEQQVSRLLAEADKEQQRRLQRVPMPAAAASRDVNTICEAEVDETLLRRRALCAQLTRRKEAMLRDRLTHDTVADSTTDESQGDRLHQAVAQAYQQMDRKLDYVIETSASESQQYDGSGVLWTELLADLSPEEREYMAKAADEMFLERMKYTRESDTEQQAQIQQHLEAILVTSEASRKSGRRIGRHMTHSLGALVDDFASIFCGCYEPHVHSDPQQLVRLLPAVATDVQQFTAVLTQVLLFKYACLVDHKPLVHHCVMGVLFEKLQPTLHALYVHAFREEDRLVNEIALLARTHALSYFHVAPVFRLDGTWTPGASSSDTETRYADQNECRLRTLHQYDAIIYTLNSLPSHRSPIVKTQMLTRICHDLDRTVKQYYAQLQDQPSPEELNMCVALSLHLLQFCVRLMSDSWSY